MKKVLLIVIAGFVITVTYLFLKPNSRITSEQIKATGFVLGKEQKLTLDSNFAAQIVKHPKSKEVVDFFEKHKNRSLDTELLQSISKEYSIDVASLFFLDRIYQDTLIQKALKIFRTSKLDSLRHQSLQKYHIVFIPGFAYKTSPETGAGLLKERKLADSLNISHSFVETEEWASSEQNGEVIAKHIREQLKLNKPIFLYSASKGGLETALAIQLLNLEESKQVKAWMSGCGILRGSPIADNQLMFGKRWWVDRTLKKVGASIAVMEDMSRNHRVSKFKRLKFPKHLKIVNYIPMPWASTVKEKIKKRYITMLPFGPNDGLTPIADQVIENATIIPEPGLNHFFQFDASVCWQDKMMGLYNVMVYLTEQKS